MVWSPTSFKGFRYRGDGTFIGKMTNDSNQKLQLASFKLSVYDTNALLIDTAAIVIWNFDAGQTRSIEAYVEVALATVGPEPAGP